MGKPEPKFDQDLRFASADESMSEEELRARANRLTRAPISGGVPRRELPRGKPRKTRRPDAA